MTWSIIDIFIFGFYNINKRLWVAMFSFKTVGCVGIINKKKLFLVRRTASVSFILYYYRLNAMATCINQLNDDCLELIFAACDGCPLTLCTLGSVCKKWYSISHRHTVVSILFL
jgi:hypothetical protein